MLCRNRGDFLLTLASTFGPVRRAKPHYLARLPAKVNRRVVAGDFRHWLRELPAADVNIIGLPAEPDRAQLQELVEHARSTCIFVWDSGRESALV